MNVFRSRSRGDGTGKRLNMAVTCVVTCLVLGCAHELTAGPGLVVGRLTWVEASESVPYGYWYYVPESALDGRVIGLVWHATPGGTDPDDSAFWARFDLPKFLACRTLWGRPPTNLAETHGMTLFSIAVPRPAASFYEARSGEPLGLPDAISSFGRLESIDQTYRNPDLQAIQSIADLESRLSDRGIPFDPRLFLTGVYTGAEWAHRFSLLHPERVRAVAPVAGNVYTMPFYDVDGRPLFWPLGLSGLETLGRERVNWPVYARIPYYITTSIHENVWYDRMTPEEQGIEMDSLDRYVEHFGSIPPEREASLASALSGVGLDARLVWSEGGHGWTDAVRGRVFEFFASFELSDSP